MVTTPGNGPAVVVDGSATVVGTVGGGDVEVFVATGVAVARTVAVFTGWLVVGMDVAAVCEFAWCEGDEQPVKMAIASMVALAATPTTFPLILQDLSVPVAPSARTPLALRHLLSEFLMG